MNEEKREAAEVYDVGEMLEGHALSGMLYGGRYQGSAKQIGFPDCSLLLNDEGCLRPDGTHSWCVQTSTLRRVEPAALAAEQKFYGTEPSVLPKTLPAGTKPQKYGYARKEEHSLTILKEGNYGERWHYHCENGSYCCWAWASDIDWSTVPIQSEHPSAKRPECSPGSCKICGQHGCEETPRPCVICGAQVRCENVLTDDDNGGWFCCADECRKAYERTRGWDDHLKREASIAAMQANADRVVRDAKKKSQALDQLLRPAASVPAPKYPHWPEAWSSAAWESDP